MQGGVAAKPEVVEKVEAESQALVSQARSIAVVRSREEYEAAEQVIREIKAAKRRVTEHHAPIIRAQEEALKVARAARDKFLNPLNQEETRVRALGAVWLSAEERRKRELEAKLLAEQTKKEERSRERQAKSLEKAGETEAAAGVRQQPLSVAPVVMEAQKGARHNWKFEVVNAALVPREWLCVDEKALGSYVRSVGDRAQIPGIRVWDELGMNVRG